jgi:protoporphyrinogen oxidase
MMKTNSFSRLTVLLLVVAILTMACDLPAILSASGQESSPAEYEVIVVGGGIAGLTAAYFLDDDDYDVLLLEKEDRVGGRAVSGSYAGFDYAQGTEYLGEPYGALKKIIRNLDIRTREIPSPMDAHFYDGEFYYGEEGLALMYLEYTSLDEINWFVEAVQEVYDDYNDIPYFDLESDLAELDQMTAEDWFDRQDFEDIFYDTYNVAARGLFGANLDEISALSYIPELGFDFEDVDPIEDPDDLSNTYPKGSWETEAYTFETGITEVTQALADALGDSIRLQATVTRVEMRDGIYWVTYQDQNEQEHQVSAQAVILAVPAPVTLWLAPTLLSTEQTSLLEQIDYAAYVTVSLFSEVPIFDGAFDLAVPDGYFFTDVYDSTWVQRYYDSTLAEKSESVLGVYIAPDSYRDRSLLEMSDEQILANVYADLGRIFPGIEDKVVGYDIQRFPYAYPVMTLGAYERLTRLHEITQGGLLLAGDYMIYPTFEAAAESGYLAAEKAMDELD